MGPEKEKIERRSKGIKFTEEEILCKVEEIGEEIVENYKEKKKFVLLTVLNGAKTFSEDLQEVIGKLKPNSLEIIPDTIQISSYGKNTESSKKPKIIEDQKIDVAGEDVLIVEDLADTGYTIDFLIDLLTKRGAREIEIATLLSKPSKREVYVPIDYLGYDVEDWIDGYGIDTNEEGREKRYIEAWEIV